MKHAKIEIFPRKLTNDWAWRLVGANGRITAGNAGFNSARAAKRAAQNSFWLMYSIYTDFNRKITQIKTLK